MVDKEENTDEPNTHDSINDNKGGESLKLHNEEEKKTTLLKVRNVRQQYHFYYF